MSHSDKSGSHAVPSYYDTHYGNFQTELYSEIRGRCGMANPDDRSYRAKSEVGGLHHRYERRAA